MILFKSPLIGEEMHLHMFRSNNEEGKPIVIKPSYPEMESYSNKMSEEKVWLTDVLQQPKDEYPISMISAMMGNILLC